MTRSKMEKILLCSKKIPQSNRLLKEFLIILCMFNFGIGNNVSISAGAQQQFAKHSDTELTCDR